MLAPLIAPPHLFASLFEVFQLIEIPPGGPLGEGTDFKRAPTASAMQSALGVVPAFYPGRRCLPGQRRPATIADGPLLLAQESGAQADGGTR